MRFYDPVSGQILVNGIDNSEIKKNSLARKVKMADLTHNMDLSRLPEITDADRERLKKYKAAYRLLSED